MELLSAAIYAPFVVLDVSVVQFMSMLHLSSRVSEFHDVVWWQALEGMLINPQELRLKDFDIVRPNYVLPN